MSAFAESLADGFGGFKVAHEGHGAGFLAERGSAAGHLALDFGAGIGDKLWRAHVAEPPARHRKTFGKTVDRNSAVFHLGESPDAHVFVGEVDEFINFIADDKHVVVLGDYIGIRFEFGAAEHGAGGVAGRRKQYKLGAFGDGFGQLLGRGFEI